MRLLLATTLALLAIATPAAATPTWLEPVPLSPQSAGEELGAEIAGDAAGHLAVAWPKFTAGTWKLQLSRRSPGGAFTPAVDLATGLDNSPDPAIAIDGQGTATIAWEEPAGMQSNLKVLRVAADGATAGAQTVSTNGYGAEVAASESGAGIVVWREDNTVRAATRGGAAAAFAPTATPVSPSPSAVGPGELQVAMDTAGNAVVAWIRAGVVEANARPAGGAFGTTKTIVNGSDANNLDLAIAPGGRATMVWSHSVAPKEVRTTERTVVPTFADGDWNDAGRASPSGIDASIPSVALDAQNTAIAIWRAVDGGQEVVQGAERPSDGTFRDFRPLSNPAASGFSARVDVAPDGSAVAIWSGSSGGRPAIQATRRGPGLEGEFGGVANLAFGAAAPADPIEYLFNPALAVDEQGNAAAVWSRFRQNAGMTIDDWQLQAAGFDAAPPAISAVSVPATGTVGSGVGMAVAATDRWTSVGFSWSFGDNTGAPGDAVTHAFGAAGNYGVTVTATDAVGNSSSAARQIAISGPAIVPRIDSTVQTKWAYDAATGKRFVLLRLKVVKPPKGTAVQIRCAGKKCPYRSKRATKRRKGDITVFKLRRPAKAAKSKDRRFRAGQRVQVRVTAAGYIGKVVKYKLKRRKDPVGKVRCLPIDASKPQKFC